MSMDYIRRIYRVPAKRGGRVWYYGVYGTITCTKYGRLYIRLDGWRKSWPFHPLEENLVYGEMRPKTSKISKIKNRIVRVGEEKGWKMSDQEKSAESVNFLLEVITECDHSPSCDYWDNRRCSCKWAKKIKEAKKWLKSFPRQTSDSPLRAAR